MRFTPSKTYSRASFHPPIATPPPHWYMQIFARLSSLVHLSHTTHYFLFHNNATATTGLSSSERVVIIHKQPTTLFHRQHYIEVARIYMYIYVVTALPARRVSIISRTHPHTHSHLYIYCVYCILYIYI